MRLKASQVAEIQRLADSAAMKKLVGLLLGELDAKSVSELLAAFLYFRANGMTNLDYAMFVATWRFPKGLLIIAQLAAVALPSLLTDDSIRALLAQTVEPKPPRKSAQ